MNPASPHARDIALLGLPVRLECDDPALLDAALQAYSLWAHEPLPPVPRPLRLTLALDPAASELTTRFREVDEQRVSVPAFGAEIQGRRLVLRVPGADGAADAAAGEARCRIAPSLGADPNRLNEVLDTLLLFMITRAGRIPLHAAGFLLGDKAVLLFGPSGAGKSSLAFEAARGGLPVLGDDTLFLEAAERVRVWGFPRPLHVPVSDRAGLDAATLRLRGGRWKHQVEPASFVRGASTGKNALCVLERGAHAAMTPLSVEAALADVMGSLEPGFDHFRAVLPGALRTLGSEGCWRLTLDDDPASGFAALRAALAAPLR